jgi:L-alanine-DL-glutamate epimerase-like enolase superfamily enzyme
VCEWHWINHTAPFGKGIWETWVKEGEIIVDGHIALTDKPGIGVEMDEAVAKTAQIPGTPWFEENT